MKCARSWIEALALLFASALAHADVGIEAVPGGGASGCAGDGWIDGCMLHRASPDYSPFSASNDVASGRAGRRSPCRFAFMQRCRYDTHGPGNRPFPWDMDRMKTLLVTGGAGFIGGNFVLGALALGGWRIDGHYAISIIQPNFTGRALNDSVRAIYIFTQRFQLGRRAPFGKSALRSTRIME